MYYKVEYIYRGKKDFTVVKARDRYEASSLAKRTAKKDILSCKY